MNEEEKMQVEPQAAGCKLQGDEGNEVEAPGSGGQEENGGTLEEELKEIDKALEDAGCKPQAAGCKESESLHLAGPKASKGEVPSSSEAEGVDARKTEGSDKNGTLGGLLAAARSPRGSQAPPEPDSTPLGRSAAEAASLLPQSPAAPAPSCTPLPEGAILAAAPPQQGQAAAAAENADVGLREHFHSLQEQASKLKEAYPDFDLSRELENPNFLRMTGPEMKIPLDLAYFALHKDDLINHSMEIAAKATEEKLAASLRTTGARPRENGAGNRSASVGHIDYAHMSKAEKDRFLAYASAETQSGRKVYL